MDLDHEEWGWRSQSRNTLDAVHDMMRGYETNTWQQILGMRAGRGPRNGFIDIDVIASRNRPASERIRESQFRSIQLAGTLMKLRFGGAGRVWGVMEEHVCSLFWCDPDHTVYPTDD